jgi:hypothetical protein
MAAPAGIAAPGPLPPVAPAAAPVAAAPTASERAYGRHRRAVEVDEMSAPEGEESATDTKAAHAQAPEPTAI